MVYSRSMVNIPAGDWLTVAETAEELKLTRRRVQALVTAGKLPAVRAGKSLLLLRSDVEAFSKLDRPHGRPREPQPKKKGKKQ